MKHQKLKFGSQPLVSTVDISDGRGITTSKIDVKRMQYSPVRGFYMEPELPLFDGVDGFYADSQGNG